MNLPAAVPPLLASKQGYTSFPGMAHGEETCGPRGAGSGVPRGIAKGGVVIPVILLKALSVDRISRRVRSVGGQFEVHIRVVTGFQRHLEF